NPVRYLDPDGADAADVLLQARRLDWTPETNKARTTASNESVNAIIKFMNLPTKAFSSAKIGNTVKSDDAYGMFNHNDQSILIDPINFGPVVSLFDSRQAQLYTIAHEVIHAERHFAGKHLGGLAEEILVRRLTIELAKTVGDSRNVQTDLILGLIGFLEDKGTKSDPGFASLTKAEQEAIIGNVNKELSRILGEVDARRGKACIHEQSRAFETQVLGLHPGGVPR
ncbi:MAG: hypothetical protein GY811_03780, partial [Myxococcales bacterium]|nr:hypothetical protein [Myxococcales bacterium]